MRKALILIILFLFMWINPISKGLTGGREESILIKQSLSNYKKKGSKIIRTTRNEDLLSPMILVNKRQPLSANFVPPDLKVPKIPFSFKEDLSKKRMRQSAAKALEKMFDAAQREQIKLVGVSAYRSYQRQQEIFSYNVRIKGEEEANKVSARPGESEHQTGLAIDVSSANVNYELNENFANTKEGQWLEKNAAGFGFIIRYPQGKEKITGYQYEPWHLRYVGVEAACRIKQEGLVLEEYLSKNRFFE